MNAHFVFYENVHSSKPRFSVGFPFKKLIHVNEFLPKKIDYKFTIYFFLKGEYTVATGLGTHKEKKV